MIQPNHHFIELPGSYLFSEISKRVAHYKQNNPSASVISLGIGDVTQPLIPSVIEALHSAVDDQASQETFHGYGPERGYAFLRETIATRYYGALDIPIDPEEIFIGDGAKSDIGNIGDIFSSEARVAVCDPVYPVYVDTNVMAGRAGRQRVNGLWDRIVYLTCTEENNFCPDLPDDESPVPDLIYLCFPNNPTGAVLSYEGLKKWVDYARENHSIILFDAAYEVFITDPVPHSIYEIEGARSCAIEFYSFSKRAGFTGLRLGFTVIPKELETAGIPVAQLWNRRQTTKFNGASYLTQRAGAAVFSEQGQAEMRQVIQYYQMNARLIRDGLRASGLQVYGGQNAPYIWLKVPDDRSSWEFFDWLLDRAQVVGTPGSGFGPSGEGYFRLTAFGSFEQTVQAMERIQALFQSSH